MTPRKDANTSRPGSQLQRICVADGKIADDTHHGRPHDLSQGKGSGGTSLDDHEHFEYLPLCRKDHDRVHSKELIIVIAGDIVRSLTPDGELLGERPMEFHDEEAIAAVEGSDTFSKARNFMFAISDEGLAHLWETADNMASSGYLYQCAIADAFHERYQGYGSAWWKRAAEFLSTSPQTVYSRWRSWGYVASVAEPELEVRRLGAATIEALGVRARAGEPVADLADEASAALDGGMTRTALARAVRSKDDVRVLPCADSGEHKCRWCAEVFA